MKLRPGLVTFVAIMMFVLGSFHIVLALSEFSDSVWVISGLNTGVLIPSRIAWGIIGFTIGVIVLYAGFRFLSGGPFGWIVGYYFAAFGVVRWLFYIPVTPVLESWSSYSTCSSSTGLPSTLSTSTSVDLLQAVQGARETSERDPDGCTFIPDIKWATDA
jgi:hypothetical protein